MPCPSTTVPHRAAVLAVLLVLAPLAAASLTGAEASSAPATGTAASDATALRLFLRDDGDRSFLSPIDAEGDLEGVGPTHAGLVLGMAEARTGYEWVLAMRSRYRPDADVPPMPLVAGGVVDALVYAQARVRNAANEPLVHPPQSAGHLELRHEVVDGAGALLGSGVAAHTFLGEDAWVPFAFRFPLGETATRADEISVILRATTAAAASYHFGHEGEHASWIELPARDVFQVFPVVDAVAYEDRPATFGAATFGGAPPFSWAWTFEDGAVSTAEAPEHAFSEPGLHRVAVTATDADGREASATLDVRVRQLDFVGTPRVVVALLDTGVNPYHLDFRRDGIAVPYDELREAQTDAAPRVVPLTFADDLLTSLAADEETWAGIAPGELVHFAGTNVLGIDLHSISAAEWQLSTSFDEPRVMDVQGHGTATASTVVRAHPDALVVAIKVGTTLGGHDIAPAYGWAVAQPWIDVVSMSLGSPGNLPVSPDDWGVPLAQREGWRAGKLLVDAAGNDPAPVLLDGCCGAPWSISVTGSEEAGDSHAIASSTLTPDFSSHFTVEAAAHDSVSAQRSASGTSFGAPTVAGTVAAAVHELRRDAGWSAMR
jgi:PKD repeat protein